MSTVASSRQNGGVVSSTQTNGDAPHQSPMREPSPPQIIHDDPKADRIQVQDWDEEAEEIEAAVEEEELIKIYQEVERLRQEQEFIMRCQAIAQHAEAQWEHINQERARLVELQYTIDILQQWEQRQQPNAIPPLPNYPIPPPRPPSNYTNQVVPHSHNVLCPRCRPNLVPSQRCYGGYSTHRPMGCGKNPRRQRQPSRNSFPMTFEKMGHNKKQLKEPTKLPYSFSGKRIEPVGVITLLVSFGTPKNPHIEYIL
jgi:hypothetical protein